MTTRKRTIRKPTDADKKKLAGAITEEREGMAKNRDIGRKLKKQRAVDTAVTNALRAAGAIRIKQDISLRELERRTGITAGNLSRIWNDPDPNITFKTLERIAAAMGHTVRIEFEEVRPDQKR
ncbi:MAG: helix-turn-helix transcriptional regulator [Planctomycetota bacterium]|nr:helix-turn-helix transcriptional regulator [Planctomycetota bacterium]MDA0918783.1 helix-turn-helix transcriptional regulator [Planctomycetota bacterium]MDA1160947.1 helix-turn-helix transcriptional regulator [Planctomycetota bacterium]